MHLSYLPDEMKVDFERSLQLGAEWGIRHLELRAVDGVNVIDLTDAQVAHIKARLAHYGMTVAALATPLFKCLLPGQAGTDAGDMHSARSLTYADHLALLPRVVALAQTLGAPYLRIFSFWRQEGAAFWPALTEAVQATLDATADSGVVPCLENEGACFIGTSEELAEAALRFRGSGLKFVWDPGNSTSCGMPPRAEDFVRFVDGIALVHLKDRIYDGTTQRSTATVIGKGQTGYATQLRWLREAGYDGALTLEPHYCPGDDCVEGMRQSVAAVRRIGTEFGVLG